MKFLVGDIKLKLVSKEIIEDFETNKINISLKYQSSEFIFYEKLSRYHSSNLCFVSGSFNLDDLTNVTPPNFILNYCDTFDEISKMVYLDKEIVKEQLKNELYNVLIEYKLNKEKGEMANKSKEQKILFNPTNEEKEYFNIDRVQDKMVSMCYNIKNILETVNKSKLNEKGINLYELLNNLTSCEFNASSIYNMIINSDVDIPDIIKLEQRTGKSTKYLDYLIISLNSLVLNLLLNSTGKKFIIERSTLYNKCSVSGDTIYRYIEGVIGSTSKGSKRKINDALEEMGLPRCLMDWNGQIIKRKIGEMK